jgi:hypothetical protein
MTIMKNRRHIFGRAEERKGLRHVTSEGNTEWEYLEEIQEKGHNTRDIKVIL